MLAPPAPDLVARSALSAFLLPSAEVPVEPALAVRTSVCTEQPPQEKLIRGSYLVSPGMELQEKERRRALHRAAIEYRTREYGFIEGFGEPSWNRLEPKHYAKSGTFFGIGVRMNNRVLTALGCVEEAIKAECEDTPYVPEVLDGLRAKNTFHNDEVSNHLYGIAIDIDPNKNSCCGCVAPLSEWPRCKVPVSSPFERTTIPKCWVDSFERYGFYWLGHDVLEDTMHFEFLGDPDKIVKPKDVAQN
ncbi:MAG: M15 family metallopeptidase [Polyangiaceae bacterium]|nr:M15 family metallopeptidase [Polyangiaceae bacterium]